MNGVHDLGGMHGFGPVLYEKDEPPFHQEWERRAFALFFAGSAAGWYGVDNFRNAIEGMDPVHYLASSYYEHWLHAFETLLIENGVVTKAELDARCEALRGEH